MSTPNLELLREAAAIIDGIPAKRFNLNSAHNGHDEPHDCGTVACAIGWLGMHPKFQAIGLRTSRVTWPGNVMWQGVDTDCFIAAMELFGLSYVEARNTFGPHSARGGGHKTEFRSRVVKLLESYK